MASTATLNENIIVHSLFMHACIVVRIWYICTRCLFLDAVMYDESYRSSYRVITRMLSLFGRKSCTLPTQQWKFRLRKNTALLRCWVCVRRPHRSWCLFCLTRARSRVLTYDTGGRGRFIQNFTRASFPNTYCSD